MSKYLIKILSVCAFVVLLPLMIVSTALGVTEAAPCNLQLFMAGDEAANATIYIDGEEVENKTVVKNSTVELTFETDEGFVLKGWYLGSDKTYKESNLLSKEERFSYNVRSNEKITAVFGREVYKVSFEGFKEDGTTPVEFEIGEYAFESELPTPAKVDANSEVQFAGWKIKNDNTSKLYKSADFAAYENGAEITLIAVWGNVKTISYYTADGKIIEGSTQVYTQSDFANFELREGVARAGYKFVKWNVVTNEGSRDAQEYINAIKSSVDFTTENIKIQAEEEVVNYNVNVEYFNGSNENYSFTYNIEDRQLRGEKELARNNYTLTGIKIGEVTYDVETEDFAKAVINNATFADETYSVNATAVWNCDYEDFGFIYVSSLQGCGAVNLNQELTPQIKFIDVVGGYDVNDSILKLLEGRDILDKNNNPMKVTGNLLVKNTNAKNPVEIPNVENITFANVAKAIKGQGWNDGDIILIFNFKLV